MAGLNKIAGNILGHIDIYLSKLNDAEYSKPLPLLSEVSIGSHTRHILDGFLCLMDQRTTGIISYDKRTRDRKLETEIAFTKQKLKMIQAFIYDLNIESECRFEASYDDVSVCTKSSLEREIIHNIEHVIHHLAIIKIALKHYHPEVVLPKSFGVAFSTLQYWETVKVSS